MTAPVVFVGSVTFDAIGLVESYPEPDERHVAMELGFACGGPAATAAATCARLGVPSAMVGAVGKDAAGDRVRESLASAGVDVTGLTTGAAPTGASVIVAAHREQTRTIVTRPVPPLALGAAARELLQSADVVHADHLGWPVLAADHALLHRTFVSVDAGNPLTPLALAGVDLYVPNISGLRRDFGDAPVDELLGRARAAGAVTVVVTRGAEGAASLEAGGARYDVPGLAVPVMSTLGAGDVFHGALVAATVRGLEGRARLAYATNAAALSCRGLDGQSAVPTHEEVMSVTRNGRYP
jgi:sulfofructose kinase